jgi:GC-rich sequence DNA-binding factor
MSLDTFSWYKSLYEYSRPPHPDHEDEGEHELGPDGDLVSAMISTAIIPRVCKLIEGGAFDPYSTKDVKTTVDLGEQIESSVERDSLKFQVCDAHPFLSSYIYWYA